ncbi:MAG TPA: FprA family A-type flavoprotein [Candidatus Sumerlaeota bacterium]|nr:MAG: Nitric oxide reductase [candidate division BRC1 bacterium ADurb.Bin183]HOE63774.1 FprA family A-type flavoprotein [Candidatus Sumerlaeota bacterium]HRR30114.1 FprA family A-type flavoprotein [Candidatus Sumerlaeia bacterium]HON49775.1 FprA family A-type flavoprotein [Candidatus Sumerlaeota bacterium]HOR63977.1 FprA family A-type flavoprotein [Candidatus Sumerlaeota bacterium]
MLGIIPVRENMFWIGMNDHETDLFESIWPLPRGVSYNSFLVRGEKIAVIDAVKSNFIAAYTDKIRALLPPGGSVDYLIVNHMEPDHSGALKAMRGIFPDMKIVGNKKTAEFIRDFYGIADNVISVDDGSSLDLGGFKLKFFLTPMVHWPETMVTYEETQKVLFSCDAFGGFGALDNRIFDDESDLVYFENEILRYYSNIVGRYSNMVQRAIDKLKDLEIAVIAPSHGPIWRKNPAHIIALYDRWSRHETEEGVVLVYASMYGNTCRMMEAISQSLAEEKMEKVRVHDISRSHVSFVLVDIWRFRGMILGSPTYNTKLFPPMQSLVHILENEEVRNRFIGVFGSYSWSKGAVNALHEFACCGRLTLVEPVVEAKCAPTAADLEQCRLLGKNMAQMVRR